MGKSKPNNLNPFRTREEVAELTVVAIDPSDPLAAAKARIVLRMNKAHKDNGSCMSFEERIKYTMSAEGTSKGQIIRSLRLYNAAGINGLMRINYEVKPDIQDRKEDSVPVSAQDSEQVLNGMNQLVDYEEKALQKAAEMAGMDLETMIKVKEACEQLGIQFVPTNPALFQHVAGKNQKHAEIGGFYTGYRFGVFAIATKNLSDVEGTPFVLQKVFSGTESCQESTDAACGFFAEPSVGPVSIGSGEEHKKLGVFFSNLQKTYPHARDTLRIYGSSSGHTKFLVGIVGSNIRNSLEKACKDIKLPTNVAIRELELLRVSMQADGGGVEYAHTENKRQLALLRQLDIDPRNLDEITEDFRQRREVENHDPRRRMTDYLFKKKTSSGESADVAVSAEGKPENDIESKGMTGKKGPGRPPGSKNKKTLEKEAELTANGGQAKPKRKPGRPPGSKNKKTLKREAREAAERAERAARGEPEPVKRKRGRPLGSKNKPKTSQK